MANEKAVFVLDVNTGGVKEGSQAAAGELDKLSASISKDKAALKELEAQMKLVQSSSKVDIQSFKRLKEQIDEKKRSIQGSSESYVAMGGKLGDVGKKASAFAGEAKKAGTAIQGAGAASQSAGVIMSRLGPLLANPYAALGAVAVAAATAGIALLGFGISSQDAARRNQIVAAAMTGSAEAGAKLNGRIGQLAKDLPIAKEEIRSLAVGLNDKGLKGNALESALGAVARTTSVLGSSAAGKLDAVINKSKDLKRFTAQALDFTGSGIALDDVASALAKSTGVSMAAAKESIKAGSVDLATGLKALDDATKTKLGGAAKELNTSLGAIGNRAGANLAGLFSTLKVEKFLGVVSDVVDMLDQSSETGKALADIVGRTFQPWLNLVGNNGGGIVSFLKDVVIFTLDVEYAALRARNKIKAFAQDPVGEISALAEKFKELGTAMIDGLVNGILGGKGKALTAMLGVGESMKTGFAAKIESRSPSRVYDRFGQYQVEGLAQGIKRTAPVAHRAMAEVIPLPTRGGTVRFPLPAAGPAAVAPAVNITVHIHGVTSERDLEARIVRVFENAARASFGALGPTVYPRSAA